MTPAPETDAVTFVGAAGMLYCSADDAAGANASALANRAKAPTNEIFFLIKESILFTYVSGGRGIC